MKLKTQKIKNKQYKIKPFRNKVFHPDGSAHQQIHVSRFFAAVNGVEADVQCLVFTASAQLSLTLSMLPLNRA